MDKPRYYQQWLQFFFDRSVEERDWYVYEYLPFTAQNAELAELIACTLENCGQDLLPYSDAQLHDGLHYIFNGAFSDVVFSLKDDSVARDLRLRAISAISNLYRDCFEQRCAPVLGHCDQPGANPLNSICYMLWDVSPLAYWRGSQDESLFYWTISNIMEQALTSKNPACVESGLHGLGHLKLYYSKRVVKIIDDYLHRKVFVCDGLYDYAQLARTGMIL